MRFENANQAVFGKALFSARFIAIEEKAGIGIERRLLVEIDNAARFEFQPDQTPQHERLINVANELSRDRSGVRVDRDEVRHTPIDVVVYDSPWF